MKVVNMLPQNKQGNHDALLLPHRGDCLSAELSSNNLCQKNHGCQISTTFHNYRIAT